MRLLAIGIDKNVADPASVSAKRQAEYYAGWDVDILVLAIGKQEKVELNPGLRVYVSGGANKIQALLNGRRLMRELAAKKLYDAVTGQDFLWSGMLAHAAALRLRCGLHLQDHSGFFGRPLSGLWELLMYPMSKRWARGADRIRTVSQRGKTGLERIGVNGDKIDVIPIATDASRFAGIAPPAGKSNVVCVARLEKEKGIYLLIEAWTEVVKSVPEAKLRIVGDGTLRKVLEQQAVDTGIKGSVEFVGRQTDVREHLEWANIAVQPSWFEGWGLSVVEAAAAGRPVVMTDVGCAGEIIKDGESGIVVPVGDSKQLATAMIRLLLDEALREKFGKRAKELACALPDPGMAVSANRASLEATVRGAGIRQKTLICAQAVDESDPLFGFFVPWLRKFAEHGDAIVCALRVSDPLPDLPSGIEVRLTRKASSKSKLEVMLNVAKTSWTERSDYQSVFIRGDAQYLACLGWLWRLLGKKVVFWYAHYRTAGPWFRLAAPWAQRNVTSVKEANPLSNAIRIGQSIDTDVYKPIERPRGVRPEILVYGRVSDVKRVPMIVDAVAPMIKNGKAGLRIVGTATGENARKKLEEVLRNIDATWEDRNIQQKESPSIYAKGDIYINATPGSLDKTILEACSSGLVTIATTPAYGNGLPDEIRWLSVTTQKELSEAVERCLKLSHEERLLLGLKLREWVARSHSIEHQLDMLMPLLYSRTPKARWILRIKNRIKHFLGSGEGVKVLMFHYFDGKGSVATDPFRLSEVLQVLLNRGYVFHSLKDFWNGKDWIIPLNGKHAVVTVDDATDDFRSASKVFADLGVPVVLCPPSGILKITTSEGVTRKILMPKELQDLSKNGLVEFAGHGVSHCHLTDLNHEALMAELKAVSDFVKGLNSPDSPPVLAYPRGRVNKRVIEAARDAGFVGGFTVVPGDWTPNTSPFLIPRFPVMNWMGPEQII